MLYFLAVENNPLLPNLPPSQKFQDNQNLSEKNNHYFEDSPYGVNYNDVLHLNYFTSQLPRNLTENLKYKKRHVITVRTRLLIVSWVAYVENTGYSHGYIK
jgi:hypothetical protein